MIDTSGRKNIVAVLDAALLVSWPSHWLGQRCRCLEFEVWVDLQGLGMNLLDCAVQLDDLTGGNLNLPLDRLDAVSGNRRLGAHHL